MSDAVERWREVRRIMDQCDMNALAYRLRDEMMYQMGLGWTDINDMQAVFLSAADTLARLMELEETPILDEFTYTVITAALDAARRVAAELPA